jgi:glycosyltransferase involved in cell wall biosynthesis
MRKNVLIFGHSYGTQFIDINNQYTQAFDPEKFDVTIAYLIGAPDETIRKRHLAKNVLFLNSAKSVTRGLKISAIIHLIKLQREKNFHIVICHRYKPSYIMTWVRLFSKIDYLFCVMHELDTFRSLSRRLLVSLLKRKNMFLAGVSNTVQADIRASFGQIPAPKVLTFYNSINVEATESLLLSKKEARASLKLSDEDFVFGTIGRLAKNKDQTTLIKGFASIKETCPKAKLIIIGAGNFETSLKKQIQDLRLQDEVILTGFLPQACRFLKAFDVFVLPSSQEAFGLVLLEAMVAKLPIIATRTDGIPEVLGETGFFVKTQHPLELADQLKTLYEMLLEERLTWGEKGYQRTNEKFSFDSFKKIFWDRMSQLKQ